MSDPWKEIADLPAEKRALLEQLLAAEGLEMPAEDAEPAEPRNEVEETLLRLWSETLERDDLGIHSNFFRLGGNSIHCIRIASRARHLGLGFTTQQMFEKPTIAELAPIVEILDPAAQTAADAPPFAESGLAEHELSELLASLNAASDEGATIEDVYTLSPVQEGMLFHILANPAPGLYCDQGVCALVGDLDAAAFREAWEKLLQRHEALRISFHWKEAPHPVQAVHSRVPLPLEVEDWRDVEDAQIEARLEELVTAERDVAMPLETPPLLRLRLLSLAADRHILLWTHHHLAHDAWSLSLLVGELLTFYEEACGRGAANFEPAPPYRSYIGWLKNLDPNASRSWWRSHLGELNRPTSLPDDRGEPVKVTLGHREYEQHERFLEAGAYERLAAAARRHELTLATFVQGAWALLLAEAESPERVVFGTVVAGRPQELPGADGMVGLFINTLPLSVAVASAGTDVSLVDWLRKVQNDVIDLRRHEQTRLVQLDEWSGMPDDLPLFESVVVVQNVFLGLTSRQSQGLEIENLRLLGHSNYPLMLRITPGEQLRLECLFDPERLRSAAAERLLERAAVLLENLADTADDATLVETRDRLRERTAQERSQRRAGFRQTSRGSLGKKSLTRKGKS